MLVRIKRALLYYAVIPLLLASSQAIAKPFSEQFCVAGQNRIDCNYPSADDCQRAAVERRGACIVNPNQKKAPSGSEQFCVVSHGRTECNYSSADDCQRDAVAWRGVCIVNTNRAR